MSTKFLIIMVVAGFSIFCVFSQIAKMQDVDGQLKLELKLTPSETSLVVGETIKLDFEVINKTDGMVTFMNTLNPKSGYLNVFISKDSYRNFNQYLGAGWGKSDKISGNISLKPNESVTNSAYIFWNGKPKISNSIAPDVIKRAIEGKIMTDYAFPEAGDYYVKASYLIYLTTQAKPILVESEPIKITIEEPVGEDLEVWNKIKDNGNFAYFIQEGDILIPSYKTKEREKFHREVEQIINQYPNSFYAESLQQSLEKFQAEEAKRQEAMQKLKQKQPQ